MYYTAYLWSGLRRFCFRRIKEIDDPLVRKGKYLDKLVDELARGRKMEKILREEKNKKGAKHLLNVEPKISVLENTFSGLRIRLTLNSHIFENNSSFQFNIANNGNNSYALTTAGSRVY